MRFTGIDATGGKPSVLPSLHIHLIPNMFHASSYAVALDAVVIALVFIILCLDGNYMSFRFSCALLLLVLSPLRVSHYGVLSPTLWHPGDWLWLDTWAKAGTMHTDFDHGYWALIQHGLSLTKCASPFSRKTFVFPFDDEWLPRALVSILSRSP